MEYLIHFYSYNGYKLESYSLKVDGEPVIIPKFERIDLFAFLGDMGEGEYWNISEKITGRSMVSPNDLCKTKEEAIKLVTKKLNKKGLNKILKTIESCEKVKDLPGAAREILLDTTED
jgi:hypothetical protein